MFETRSPNAMIEAAYMASNLTFRIEDMQMKLEYKE